MEDQNKNEDSFYDETAYVDQDLDELLEAPLDDEEELLVLDEDEFELSQEEEKELKRLQAKLKRQDIILRTFASLEERPTDEQIEGFKQQYGECYLASFSEKENFLFRPLKRQEWRNLMAQTAKLDEFKKSEAIVMRGIVFPKLNNMNIGSLAAGTVDSLRDLILEASNFMSPDRSVQLVRKL